MQQSTEHHPAFEEYCECIFELEEDHVELIQARIAERLKVSRASVSEMIKRMDTEGLVNLSGPRIALTDSGRKLAEGIVRKHRLAECFLIDVLGLSWSTAHHEACKWEHVINDEVEVALAKMLGNPTACPHGNPIPGSGHRSILLTPLDTIEVGDSFTVVRISEELEETSGALDTLEANKMFPGRSGTVANRGVDGGVSVLMTDSADSAPTQIDSFISSRLLVTTKK
ncbi:MAG: metal-dependent transcriptional regulator [Actinobacteria bacterium]|nr:metal-dependent transcriptional regulator [Acidimicrobiia bacterium]NCU87351.1 metal-dependent transcriptional regulator [Actinomycetota bacterium]NCW83835.1 metal-dependent transcriptional regulator [Acidimicrobiia bacterium]NDA37143.1 metal-dependent transcriptional regulator [Acidimicrobiia bacterium]NDB26510.1 metal-dependent transcriptional regulator [Actinomycetota bacterium]